MGRLNDRIALVTGGAMGIGRASSELFAQEGATVIVTDVEDEAGEAVVDAINKNGGNAMYLHHDVTSEDAWQAVLKAILDKYGHLHILVNNAGIAIGKPLIEMTLEEFRRQNAVNLDGVFLGLKYCIPAIADAGGGSIINLSSAAGLKGAPGLAAYSMTKGGVRLLTKSAARECAGAGNRVRINSVHPGIIETAIWDKMGNLQPGANRADVEGIATTIVPGGVLGKPADVANGILFLASDESSYMTGSELVIDHGYTA